MLGCFDLTDVLSLAWQIAKLEVYFILFFVDLKISLESGVCKTRTGYLRMADADGKMRMEKCEWKKMRITKKVRRKKREMRMAKKINK